MQVYTTVVSSSYDNCVNIYTCGVFLSEKDAVISVINKIFEKELIQHNLYVDSIQAAIDDGHVDEDNELEQIEQMTNAQFAEFVKKQVYDNPTVEKLTDVCAEYDDDFDCDVWSFNIEAQNIQ